MLSEISSVTLEKIQPRALYMRNTGLGFLLEQKECAGELLIKSVEILYEERQGVEGCIYPRIIPLFFLTFNYKLHCEILESTCSLDCLFYGPFTPLPQYVVFRVCCCFLI